jgi:hypothetical protein
MLQSLIDMYLKHTTTNMIIFKREIERKTMKILNTKNCINTNRQTTINILI